MQLCLLLLFYVVSVCLVLYYADVMFTKMILLVVVPRIVTYLFYK